MFDYHIHSRVSFDGHDRGVDLAMAAKQAGLKEICFTDHVDEDPFDPELDLAFDIGAYAKEYDGLEVPGLAIRRGLEFGMTEDNQALLKTYLARREFDFCLGSVHFVDGLDVYYSEFWQGRTVAQAERRFLEQTLACVRAQEEFDVLAHLSFLSKAWAHPTNALISYESHRELIDEILKALIRKDKGLEVNTSGMDRCGGYLPTLDIVRRFHDLGGKIVTVGSDAHRANRVGQYCFDVCDALGEIFGYVCTFRQRQPIFHKL